MNISRVTKKLRPFLNPIERKIKSKKVEHLYKLDKNGKVLDKVIGDEDSVTSKYVKNIFVSTHNHPDEVYNSTLLSPDDIYNSIIDNEREARMITKDGFCHLVEIPKMSLSKENECLGFLSFYIKYLWLTGWDHSVARRMQNGLKKIDRFKFRTIPVTPGAKKFVKNLKKKKEIL